MNEEIFIFTDGACSGNPGPGGYGIILTWNHRNYRKEFSNGFVKTTNNRMELIAIIDGLKKIKYPNKTVRIFSDSKYVVEAVTKKWVFNWEKKGFKNRKNADLWREFLKHYKQHHVEMQWIKGHSGHLENERCDKLATAAIKSNNLEHDWGFENLQ